MTNRVLMACARFAGVELAPSAALLRALIADQRRDMRGDGRPQWDTELQNRAAYARAMQPDRRHNGKAYRAYPH